MSRQTERAAARRQAKIDNAAIRFAARAALRKEKGLLPMVKPRKPAEHYVPVQTRGKSYPFSSKRQNAKQARIAAGRETLDLAA